MRVLNLLLSFSILVAGCSSNDASDRVSVFAAASLTDVMDEIGAAFEVSNPGLVVEYNFAGSTTLRTQLLEGAAADVVMLANTDIMAELSDAGLISGSSTAAGNRMVLAIPASNPGGVTRLSDMGDHSLLIGLCDIEVPCGAAARSILAAAGVVPELDTNEPDVRALLAKIASAELDAGIVYKTDLKSAGPAVRGIEIDSSLSEPSLYPIAVLKESKNPVAAKEFLAFVLSDAGQSILAGDGFLTRNQAESQ